MIVTYLKAEEIIGFETRDAPLICILTRVTIGAGSIEITLATAFNGGMFIQVRNDWK